MARQRVLILFGGRSSEHQISCLSARSVLGAMDRGRYEPIPVGITRAGRWVLTDGDIAAPPGAVLPEVADAGPTVALVQGRSGPRLVRFEGGTYADLGPVDVCFPVLHGPYGEDGTVQGLLATIGVPYVGADVTASSVGIDKRAAKFAFRARGLPQGPWLPIRRERYEAEQGAFLDEVEAELSYPLFVKPARQGSSIGITRAGDRRALQDAIEEAFRFDRVAIIEQALEGARELEVGVLGNDRIDVTRPGEVIPSHEFYDFEAKYLDASELVVPAEVSDGVVKRIDEIARQAYQAIGCRGMARIDFFLLGDELLLNEINTVPGFTPSSMFPRLWEAEGLGYPALVDRLLDLALHAQDAAAHYAP